MEHLPETYMKILLKISLSILVLFSLEIKSKESVGEEKDDLDTFFAQELKNVFKNSSINVKELKTLIEVEIESQAVSSPAQRFSTAFSLAIRKGYFQGLTPQETIAIVRAYYASKCESGLIDHSFIDVISVYDDQ
jgi:hypothetical protein